MGVVSIEDAAVEVGMELHVFIGLLCDSSLLRVSDWCEDCNEFWHRSEHLTGTIPTKGRGVHCGD